MVKVDYIAYSRVRSLCVPLSSSYANQRIDGSSKSLIASVNEGLPEMELI